jgi:hypothetical protein
MEVLPFDVLAYMLSRAARCDFFGWELLQLRLVSRTWLRACDSPAVVRAWHAVNCDYVVWEMRTSRWQPPWPECASGFAKGVREVVGRKNRTRMLIEATPGALALLHWMMCEAAVWSARNGRNAGEPLAIEKDDELFPEDDPDDSEYSYQSEEELELLDDESDQFYPVPQDGETEDREEMERDEDAMPASFNYLHWACGSLMQNRRNRYEYHVDTFSDCSRELLGEVAWDELVDEKCCVTGLTPLLALLSDCDDGDVNNCSSLRRTPLSRS